LTIAFSRLIAGEVSDPPKMRLLCGLAWMLRSRG
jgi:hypothetical protein